ncbi:hypothetical protein [Bacillus sp. JJ722]|uniref:hypothetical protein n=1 Tax=Bacillus sp. JJ722 TaxID=3122973 RepID=UPI003000F74D
MANNSELIMHFLDKHGESFYTCKGCEICTEMHSKIKDYENGNKSKYKKEISKILKKGEDITTKDLEKLIAYGVSAQRITKALRIGNKKLNEILRYLNIKKMEDVEEIKKKATVEECKKLNEKGFSLREKAEYFGKTINAQRIWEINKGLRITRKMKKYNITKEKCEKLIEKGLNKHERAEYFNASYSHYCRVEREFGLGRKNKRS